MYEGGKLENQLGEATIRMLRQSIGVKQETPHIEQMSFCENIEDDSRLMRKSTILSILRRDSFNESGLEFEE